MINRKTFCGLLTEANEIAENITQNVNNYFSSKLYTEGIRRDFNTILKCFKSDFDKKILDFGCGTSYFSMLLSNFFEEVYGVDVDLYTHKICGLSKKEMRRLDLENHCIWREYTKKYQIIFNDYDSKKLPYPNDYFDSIVAYVVEHIADDLLDDVLEEIFRVLKRDGSWFIFKMPRDSSYAEKIIHSHKKLINEREFFTLLRSHDFSISKFYRTDILPEFYPFGLHKIVNFLIPIIFPIQNLLDKSLVNFLCHNLNIIAKK